MAFQAWPGLGMLQNHKASFDCGWHFIVHCCMSLINSSSQMSSQQPCCRAAKYTVSVRLLKDDIYSVILRTCWLASTALYRTLLHGHHDFFLATKHVFILLNNRYLLAKCFTEEQKWLLRHVLECENTLSEWHFSLHFTRRSQYVTALSNITLFSSLDGNDVHFDDQALDVGLMPACSYANTPFQMYIFCCQIPEKPHTSGICLCNEQGCDYGFYCAN